MDNTANVVYKVAEISTLHAATKSSGSGAAGAIMECIVGAAIPMVSGMFEKISIQDRLLFSLILVGSCTTIGEYRGEDGPYEVTIEVNPATLRDAIDVFKKLTGTDIRPSLPKSMVEFAGAYTIN